MDYPNLSHNTELSGVDKAGQSHSEFPDTDKPVIEQPVPQMPEIVPVAPATPEAPESRIWKLSDVLIITVISLVLLFAGLFGGGALLSLFNSAQPIPTKPTLAISLIAFAAEFVALFIGVWLVMRLRRLSWSQIGFRLLTPRWITGAIGLALLVMVAGSLASYLVAFLVAFLAGQPLTNPQLPALAPEDLSWAGIVLFVLLGGLAVPFVEELLFRGVYYNYLRSHFGVWIAAFASALIFAVVHLDLLVGATAFVLGLFNVYAYERSKSLWASVIVHGLSNALKLVILYAWLSTTMKIPLF
ncbi:MAG: CPBP family intramembrane metalloprotease [Ktedonobacteraceae bacterium]|nr:CPBP family intramembrane metalloprotease [Ktedonobacteraceae bacterium]